MRESINLAGFDGSKLTKGSALNVETQCWEWQKNKSQSGYGVIRFKGKTLRVHRVAFQLTHGFSPSKSLTHTCRVRHCINPAHLIEIVPFTKQSSGRGKTKLTAEAVREIRRLHSLGGITQKRLAKDFGVTALTIHSVIHRKSWAHVA